MILTVGLNCIDIVSWVPTFIREDQDKRCTRQEWARGGNASNNATVLACLGASVEFFGTLSNDHLLKFFTDDFNRLGIKCDLCPVIDGIGRAPSSVVICSEETGSRTIVHAKGDLRELTLDDFQSKIQLGNYSWIHFEGRGEVEVVKMIEKIREFNDKNPLKGGNEESPLLAYRNVRVPISIEVEKCRESLNTLIPLAHVVFIGKDFAAWQGAKDCKDGVKIMLDKVNPGTLVICPWGEDGAAYGIKGDKEIRKIDAVPPSKIIDSLGAGDTFIAATIFCLDKRMDVNRSIGVAARVASAKLSIYGFVGLKEKAGELLS